jgi:pimeloyl-ACP methyl ester carboxylesterase
MDTFQHIRLQSIRVITRSLPDGKVVYVFIAIFSRDTYQYGSMTPEKSRGQTTNPIAERCAEGRLQTSDARTVAFCYFADYASDTTRLSGHTLTGWLGLVVCPREVLLDGVAKHISCPVLITHGEKDTVVPVEMAHKLYADIGSEDKTLKIFSVEEGGCEHMQGDNRLLGANFVADWVMDRLAR